MGSEQTFAYLLAASSWSEEVQRTITDCWYGDIIERLMSCEDQASGSELIWPFGWERGMSRIAPIQLTSAWDPRPCILSVFREAGVEPIIPGDDCAEESAILFFQDLPSPEHVQPGPSGRRGRSVDEARFDEVLHRTVELARLEGRGLLFVGGWGWSYDEDELRGTAEVLREAGMQVLTRHG